MIDLQNIIVGILLIGAFAYAGVIFVRKTRAFSTKSGCADDCGCSSKSTQKTAH